MVGLLGYPFLLERTTSLANQTLAWSVAYVVLAVLVAGCGLVAVRTSRRPARADVPAREVPPAAGARLTRGRRLRWVALAFLPSAVMLGATAHVSTDIAPVPLF